ncbi:hypothetical protein BDV18DRAFT_146706 [Aspergillus unguis]
MDLNSSSRVRKRRRPASSCIECRRRKVRCDRTIPCRQCKAHNAPSCTYTEPPRPTPMIAENSHTVESERTHRISEQAAQPDGALPRTCTAPARIRGALNKTRVYGYGHWMNSMSMLDGLPEIKPLLECYQSVLHGDIPDSPDSASITLAECKTLSKDGKRQRPSRNCLPSHVYRTLPAGAVMDDLVQLYFATFESCYRILYYPSFMKEYGKHKNDLENANACLVLELLLIMSTAGALHDDAHIRDKLATQSPDWIQIAQTWLSGPLEKDRLTLDGIQIHCLLLLARQVTRLGADLVWISAGSLVRMAMQMGLHLEPSAVKEMCFRDQDIRRRLWYTILELNVQAALDSGMSPMICVADFTTRPPSKLTDNELETGAAETKEQLGLQEQSFHKELPSLLAQSLPLRLTVTRVINSLQEEPAYEEVVRLGSDLAAACQTATTALNPNAPLNCMSDTSRFVVSHFTHLLRRFTLCLHFPYAVQARKTPLFTYSHKQCLDAALDIAAILDDKLYSRLLLTGGGLFRDLITRGAFVLYLELSSEIDSRASVISQNRSRPRQESILRDLGRIAHYAKDRMFHGETNVKGYVFINMAAAQMEALMDGSPPEEYVMRAAKDSLETCRQVLVAKATTSSSIGTELAVSHTDMSLFEDLDEHFDFLRCEAWNFDLGSL